MTVQKVNMEELNTANRPPLVKGLPVIGSVLPLLNDPHEFLKQSYLRYGDVFRFKAAHRHMTVLAGQDANRFISGEGRKLLGVEDYWGDAFEYMGCPHALVGVDGEIHAYQRKILSPMMQASVWADKLPELVEPIQALISENTNKKANVGHLFRQMISNQIGYNLTGYKTSYKKVQHMIYYFGSVTNVFILGKWPKIMLSTPKFQLAKSIALRNSIKTLDIAKSRTAADKERSSHYLDAVIPAIKQKPEWFTEGDLLMYAMLPYVGALDTVASNMGFMLHRLLLDEDLKQRILREVDDAFADGVPDIKTLRGMRDLNGLVKETLRTKPVAFGIPRTANEDFTFKDFEIRKGEDVLVFTTADHTNPKYFPNPERFDIERNSVERNEFKQPAFAPFGKGPHTCIGASLAEIILPLNMGLILRNLDFRSACNLRKVKTVYDPAPVLTNNFKVRFSPRRDLMSRKLS